MPPADHALDMVRRLRVRDDVNTAHQCVPCLSVGGCAVLIPMGAAGLWPGLRCAARLLVDGGVSTKSNRCHQEPRVLVYPSAVDLSSSALRFLARELTARRRRIGSRWRRLSTGRQALLVLAHLRCGDTYARLAAAFRIGIATVYRYVSEAVEVLAALATDLREALRRAVGKAYVILDGTLLPIDRIAADRPFYSGKHKQHSMNVQVMADPFGRLLWASPALPGATHDLTAARQHDIIGALAEADIPCWADKGYQGAGGTVRVPFRGRHRNLPASQQAVNVAHARIRAVGEHAMATLKGWRLLRKLRCSTTRITGIVQAILALHLASA